MANEAITARRPGSRLQPRVVAAADALLARGTSVSPVEVLIGIGWLSPSAVDAWRRGRIQSLEHATPVHPDKLAAVLQHLRCWAAETGLTPNEVAYLAPTRDRRALRFSAGGDQAIERAWGTHWLRPDVSETARQRILAAQGKAPDLVSSSRSPSGAAPAAVGRVAAAHGGRRAALHGLRGPGPPGLPAGDAALSRRARKASRLAAVVVRFSRSRRRYERRGVLVEEAALRQAEAECLADEDARARRRERDRQRRADQDVLFEGQLAEAVTRLFPGCPLERAAAIARFAAVRGSGRVGRSAAGRALDDRAVRLAVAASVRHGDTGYDDLLMAGVPRPVAREQVRPAIDRVLAAWEAPAETRRRGSSTR